MLQSRVSSPKKRSRRPALTATSPKGRKGLKQSLLGHFTSVRSYDAAEFDLLDQKYGDVQNAAKEETVLSMDYEKEDLLSRKCIQMIYETMTLGKRMLGAKPTNLGVVASPVLEQQPIRENSACFAAYCSGTTI
jgi:hypothetical protein